MMAAPAALAPAVVFLLGPYTIFTTNLDEFAVGFGSLAAPWLIRAAAVNWLVLFVIGGLISLSSDRFARVYCALLFASGCLLWAQGHLYTADYGPLTGDDIDFAVHAWRTPYEGAVWVGGLVAAAVLFRPVSRVAPLAATVFLALQLAAGAVVDREPAGATGDRHADPPPAIYQFSAETNVIHVVLDAFQSDVFHELLQENGAAFDRQFAGFVFFADHASTFPTTAFSMVAMLTGEAYRNHMPAAEFTRQAFTHSSVFAAAARAGFEIDVISIVPPSVMQDWLGSERRPRWKGARYRIRKPFVGADDYREVTARQLIEHSVFRHVPHPVKAALGASPDVSHRIPGVGRGEPLAETRREHSGNAAAFFQHFVHSMTVEARPPLYKLLHLGLPHRPVVVDGECRFIGATRVSRETFRGQAQCAVKRVSAFLDRLRALGIYDSSVIIIASDHGTGLAPDGFTGHSDSISPVPLSDIAGAAKALMLIKPPRRSGPVVVSAAPTSHVDLPATIIDLAGGVGDWRDQSMFRRDPDRPRTRWFGMYSLRERFPKDYFTRLDVLRLDRAVVDAAGWALEQSVWRPDMRLDATEIDIGTDSGDLHVGHGWSEHRMELIPGAGEVTFVEAATARAVLYATLPSRQHQLTLHVASTGTSGQYVRIDIDGRNRSRHIVPPGPAYGELVVDVPADPERPPISGITLQFDTAPSSAAGMKLDRLAISAP